MLGTGHMKKECSRGRRWLAKGRRLWADWGILVRGLILEASASRSSTHCSHPTLLRGAVSSTWSFPLSMEEPGRPVSELTHAHTHTHTHTYNAHKLGDAQKGVDTRPFAQGRVSPWTKRSKKSTVADERCSVTSCAFTCTSLGSWERSWQAQGI